MKRSVRTHLKVNILSMAWCNGDTQVLLHEASLMLTMGNKVGRGVFCYIICQAILTIYDVMSAREEGKQKRDPDFAHKNQIPDLFKHIDCCAVHILYTV